MDIIFRTYTRPDHEPEKFGIKEEFPKNYLGQLVNQLLPSFLSKKWRIKKHQQSTRPNLP
ncbi:hypothetical protein, partial [Rhizobium leguminosarum]|uniref:hypothetical protein n=1 Tax=Rhizobium leguminosarum TaxID=384 RepID=UPI003F9C95B2